VWAGVILIAAGLGLFLTSRSYLDVAGGFNKARAKDARARQLPRTFQALFDANARWGAAAAVWLGRGLGAAALIAGVILLLRG
jgi:hypothetical protein